MTINPGRISVCTWTHVAHAQPHVGYIWRFYCYGDRWWLFFMLSKLNITESIWRFFASPGSLVTRQHEKRDGGMDTQRKTLLSLSRWSVSLPGVLSVTWLGSDVEARGGGRFEETRHYWVTDTEQHTEGYLCPGLSACSRSSVSVRQLWLCASLSLNIHSYSVMLL